MFIFGLIIGGILGIGAMVIVSINRGEDDDN